MRQSGGNQAVNLSGMLSSIADTLGSGFEINGESAGVALGNNIREAAKPELDMKDPASIRKYAEWQGRNGKEKESMMMLEKANEVEDAANMLAAVKDSAVHVNRGEEAVQAGQTLELEGAIDNLTKSLGLITDGATYERVNERLDKLKAQRGTAADQQTEVYSDTAMRMHKALKENPDAGVSLGLNKLLQDPKVRAAFQQKRVNDVAAEGALREDNWKTVVSQDVAAKLRDLRPEEFEEQAAKIAKEYPEYAAQIDSMSSAYFEHAKSTSAFYDSYAESSIVPDMTKLASRGESLGTAYAEGYSDLVGEIGNHVKTNSTVGKDGKRTWNSPADMRKHQRELEALRAFEQDARMRTAGEEQAVAIQREAQINTHMEDLEASINQNLTLPQQVALGEAVAEREGVNVDKLKRKGDFQQYVDMALEERRAAQSAYLFKERNRLQYTPEDVIAKWTDAGNKIKGIGEEGKKEFVAVQMAMGYMDHQIEEAWELGGGNAEDLTDAIDEGRVETAEATATEAESIKEFVPPEAGREKLSRVLARLYGSVSGLYGNVAGRQDLLNSTYVADFSDNKTDITVSGLPRVTPRTDVRTPEQIENNAGLRSEVTVSGLPRGTPRTDVRTPEQIANNAKLADQAPTLKGLFQ